MGKTQPAADERQVFGIRVLRPTHPDLRRLRATHSPHYQGHKLWNATWLLLSFLDRCGLPRDVRVLEAGCGWGLAGIYCARRFGAAVTAVDVDEEVFPFLELHARNNGVAIETVAAGFEEVADGVLARQDVLMGADICFRESMVAPLMSLLHKSRQCGVGQAVLSDPGRLAFRSLASACQRDFAAVELEWQVQEPVLTWPGAAPIIHGRVLLIGSWPPHLLA